MPRHSAAMPDSATSTPADISPASSRDRLPRISPPLPSFQLPDHVGAAKTVAKRGSPPICSVAQLMDKYDAFLLDQFGVLHDGSNALPGAIDCFAQLIAAGKKCVVLSNTSRRGGAGAGKLKAMGFAADALSGFVASGELAYQYMLSQWRGKKALWFGWPDQPNYIDGLDLVLASASEADFVLCQGTQTLSDGASVAPVGLFESGIIDDALSSVLEACAARSLLMVCCNPDFTVVRPGGGRGHMPGRLAREYEARGGTVVSFGKPSTKAFEAGVALVSEAGGIRRERVCHVGDSLHHDIAGANASGVDSLWVTATGIHAEELFEKGAETTLDQASIKRVVDANGGHEPTHVTMGFRWDG